jgi:hypothetical protein
VLGGGLDPMTTAAIGPDESNDGVRINSAEIYSDGGNISIRGTGEHGVHLRSSTISSLSSSVGNGAITIEGTGTSGEGIKADNTSMLHAGNGDVSLTGTSSEGDENVAVELPNITTDHGNIFINSFRGNEARQVGIGIHADSVSIISHGGNIHLKDNTASIQSTDWGLLLTGENIFGHDDGDTYDEATGNITFEADTQVFIDQSSDVEFNTSGTVTFKSLSSSFGGYVDNIVANETVAGFRLPSYVSFEDVTGLTIGKTSNLSDVKIYASPTIDGTIRMYANDLFIDGGIRTTGDNMIALHVQNVGSTGSSGYLDSDDLALFNGSFVLNNANNDIDTIAGESLRSLNFVDSDSLRVGSVNPEGISATGQIHISTLTGNLTIAESIVTTNTGEGAIVLNAGSSHVVGDATGGNIIISGSPTISTGVGGRATLYTGSITQGITDFVGSGSSRFRYDSDETTTNYAAPIYDGTYAIFREQPTLTVTANDQSITYGQFLPILTYSVSGTVNGDDVEGFFSASPTLDHDGTFSSSNFTNAGSWNITAAGAAEQFGYAIEYVEGTLAVAQLSVNVGGLAVSNKTYDGTRTATVDRTGVLLAGVLSEDQVTLDSVTALFNSKSAGTGKLVTVDSANFSGTDEGNYTFVFDALPTADITPRDLFVSGVTAFDRVYDGTLDASLNTENLELNGYVDGDDVNLAILIGQFQDKNAGVDKTVDIYAFYSGEELSNYNIIGPTTTTADITPKDLIVSGITANNKIYDGHTTAIVDGSGATFSGLVDGDEVTITTLSGLFADKNAGNGKTVNLSTSFAGDDAGNYTITEQETTTANISRKQLVIGGWTAIDRVYDGSTNVVIDSSNVEWGGLVAGDEVSFAGLDGSFLTKDVGTNKQIQLSIELTGNDVNNYNPVGGDVPTASITPKALIVSGITAADRVYNGTTDVAVDGESVEFDGLVDGDLVHFNTLIGNFRDKNVGTEKTVDIAATYTGADAGNYSIVTQATTEADISQKALFISGITGVDKEYNRSTDAVLDVTGVILSGLIEGDQVVVNSGTGSFLDWNVGINKTMFITDLSFSGEDLNNYAATVQPSTTATITPRTLRVSGITAEDRVYDGTTLATLSPSGLAVSGDVDGDDLQLDLFGNYLNKHVGMDKVIMIASELSGVDAGNYVLDCQTETTGNITPRSLIVSGLTILDKFYDGTTNAEVDLSGVVTEGQIEGDELALNLNGQFDSAEIGENKVVTILSELLGDDAGNYSLLLNDNPGLAAILAEDDVQIDDTAGDEIYHAVRDTNTRYPDDTGAAKIANTVQRIGMRWFSRLASKLSIGPASEPHLVTEDQIQSINGQVWIQDGSSERIGMEDKESSN